jgi:hypothetical protein
MVMSLQSEVPTYPSEGFLLDEDRALRDRMKGIVVSDNANAQRNVEAWFGHPDLELREQKYPYITVDLLEIQEGIDRVHRGDLFLTGGPAPAGVPEWWGYDPIPANHTWVGEMTTPVDLIYQVGTWARNPRHDRQILRACLTRGRTNLRGGVIATADGYTRRLDFLGHIKRDREEGGKRLFNNIFRLRMSAEVPYGALIAYRNIDSVHLGVRTRADDFRGNVLDQVVITEE